MCKSQFREVPHPEVQPCMLLSDELHNWLLFMDLKADQEGRRTDPRGRYLKGILKAVFNSTSFSTGECDQQPECPQPQFSEGFTGSAYRISCSQSPAQSSGEKPPSTMVSKRVQGFRNANRTLPVGPLRCLAMMISALPCSSGSSCR